MICAAAFSPSDGRLGQLDREAELECVAQFKLAVARCFKPGTPPF
jgi:hypothetical protein